MHLAVQVINALQDGTGAQDPAFNANSAKLKTRREGERARRLALVSWLCIVTHSYTYI